LRFVPLQRSLAQLACPQAPPVGRPASVLVAGLYSAPTHAGFG
jgi:hypothetical protein